VRLEAQPASKSDHPRITAIARGRGADTSLLEDAAEMGFTAVDGTELSSAHPNQDLLRGFAMIYLADIAREAIVLQDRNELKKSEALLREALDKYRGLLEKRDIERYEHMLEELKYGMSMANRKYHRESSHQLNACMKMAPERYDRK
jgi:hypothetical protein